MSEPLVLCDNLVKIYKVADLEVVALQGLDLEVIAGEIMAIVGASGSGKSTLLNILSGLDLPSAGKCVVDKHDLTRLSQAQRVSYKRFIVGHIWQQSGRNLLQELTIQANVELPQVLGGIACDRIDAVVARRRQLQHRQVERAEACLHGSAGCSELPGRVRDAAARSLPPS